MARRGDEILQLAATGLTDKQIAEELRISVRTVEGHWRRLREQTGIPNRSGLLGAMLRDKLNRERQQYEEEIARLQNHINNQENRELGLQQKYEDFEKLVRERAVILHEELNTLYQEVNRLKSKHIQDQTLANIVLKSNVLAVRVNYQAPHDCLYISESVRQFGYRPDDFTQARLHISNLIHPEDFTQAWSQALQEFEQGNRLIDRRYRIVTRTGDIRWMFDRTVLELDPQEQPTSIASFAFDITHLGQDVVQKLESAPTPYSL